jgi:hypothetical protein
MTWRGEVLNADAGIAALTARYATGGNTAPSVFPSACSRKKM